MYCNQCGHLKEKSHDGMCTDCWEINQEILDNHNAEYDTWNNFSDKEKDIVMKWAMRYG